MLNLKKIVGVIAIIAIASFAFFSCEEDAGAPGAPGLLSIPDLTGVPKSAGSANVTNRADAISLFEDMLQFYSSNISSGLDNARDVALLEKDWIPILIKPPAAEQLKKSLSVSLNFTDTTKLLASIGGSAGTEVKEKSSFKWSSNNYTYAEDYTNYYGVKKYAVGDKFDTSNSYNRTVKIPAVLTENYNDYDGNNKTGKIGGTFVIDYKSNWTKTVKTITTAATNNEDMSTDSGSASTKFAAAVYFDNGTNAAIFRFASSDGGDWANKSGSWEGGNKTSTIEVYKTDGTKLDFVIEDSDIWYGIIDSNLVQTFKANSPY